MVLATGATIRTLIAAEEHMALVMTHGGPDSGDYGLSL
jgi:hypothetical protein